MLSTPRENSSQYFVLRSGAAKHPSSSNTAPCAHFKDDKLLDYRRHCRTVLFNTYRRFARNTVDPEELTHMQTKV